MTDTSLLSLLAKGGLMMWPIGLCSIIALAVILERYWTLRGKKIAPAYLVADVLKKVKDNQLNQKILEDLQTHSVLGRILVAGLVNAKHGREMMKEAIQNVATYEVHGLQRYLNILGTIAGITPLLGLLGTVFGMIHVFSAIVMTGDNAPEVLAAGIAEALICTAAGLFVAIPSLFFHRILLGHVESLTVLMEQEAIRLVDVVQGEREATEAA